MPRLLPLSLCTLLVGTGIAGTEVVSRRALSTPAGLTQAQIAASPRFLIARQVNAPIFDKIRALVAPGEHILALVYQPDFYFAAGRLPMDGFYEYLPWDAEYAEAPWFGRDRDLCVSMSKSPPPVVEFDNRKVWDYYAPADYMPCVLEILHEKYERQRDFPDLYVRLDRIAAVHAR